MSLTLPKINLPATPKALFDIMRLEAGPSALPLSRNTTYASLAAYAAGETGVQFLDHQLLAAILFGLVSVAFLIGLTVAVLHLTGARDHLLQTLTALGATGAAVALIWIGLYLLFSQVFPPPLPTSTLVKFLLFPLLVWNVMLFTWLYRHAQLRFIPAFSLSAAYVGITTFVVAPLVMRVTGA